MSDERTAFSLQSVKDKIAMQEEIERLQAALQKIANMPSWATYWKSEARRALEGK